MSEAALESVVEGHRMVLMRTDLGGRVVEAYCQDCGHEFRLGRIAWEHFAENVVASR